jgi:hypothetical protein
LLVQVSCYQMYENMHNVFLKKIPFGSWCLDNGLQQVILPVVCKYSYSSLLILGWEGVMGPSGPLNIYHKTRMPYGPTLTALVCHALHSFSLFLLCPLSPVGLVSCSLVTYTLAGNGTDICFLLLQIPPSSF